LGCSLIHNDLVMEFEHPIFNTPEEYEEYHQIMAELAEEAERNAPDPRPQDLGLNNNSYFNQKNVDTRKVQA
jgi:hypothetical protein